MRKITSLFLFLSLLFSNMFLSTAVAANVYSGYCGAEGDGTNIQWQFDEATGVISFVGTGKMQDWRHKTSFDQYEQEFTGQTTPESYAPWYQYRDKITRAVFSDGITVMGNFVLGSSKNLKEVVLGKDLTNIGVGSFTECTSLTAIALPSKVTFIGVGAFYGATALSSVTLPEGLDTIYYGAFADCKALQSISLPSTLAQLNAGAFAMSGIKSIVLPEKIKGVSSYTFYNCSALQSIRFLGEISYINECAFAGCPSTFSIKIPDTCTSIHQHAFTAGSLYVYRIYCYEGSYGETFCIQNKVPKGLYKVINHEFNPHSVVEPTCLEKGYSLYYCKECDSYRKQDFTDAIGHRMGAWYIASVATADSEGQLACSCLACNETEYKAYPYHTPGDTDLDDELTVYDVILVLQQMAGIKEFDALALSAGDLNLNYAIDTEDATMLLKRVSGSEVYFPSEHPEAYKPQ